MKMGNIVVKFSIDKQNFPFQEGAGGHCINMVAAALNVRRQHRRLLPLKTELEST